MVYMVVRMVVGEGGDNVGNYGSRGGSKGAGEDDGEVEWLILRVLLTVTDRKINIHWWF